MVAKIAEVVMLMGYWLRLSKFSRNGPGASDLVWCDGHAESVDQVKSADSIRGRRGVDRHLARTAGSAHGPRRLANSAALAIALPNAYFDSLGIPRLTVQPIA